MRRTASTQLFATAEAAEEAFYDAMERADVDAMMALWADDEDSVCVHPGGARLVGLPSIRAAWEEIFRDGGMHIRPTDVKIYQSGTVSVHSVVEQVVVHGRFGTEVVRILATNVYVKGPIGWQIIAHQGAPAADPSAQQAAVASQGLLH